MHGRRTPLHFIELMTGEGKVDDAALAEHRVEIEFPAQTLPQFERMLVQMRAVVPHVIRAHDCCVATCIAESNRAFLEHGDAAQTVILCEVVRGRKPVAAAPTMITSYDFFAVAGRQARGQ